MIHRDKPKRLRFAAIAAAIVVLAGGGYALLFEKPPPLRGMPLGSLKQPSPMMIDPSAPVVAQAPASMQAPTPSPKATAAPPPTVLHPKAAEYERLTAPGATPAMLSEAFELVLSCRREANVLAHGVQTHPLSKERCQLPPGEPQAAALKRMLKARVARADFNAYADVQRERTGVYADDPEGWKALVKEAREVGIKRGEPIVMLAEAGTQLSRGETLQEMGMLAEAQAAYQLALRYQVAHALGMAKLNRQPENLSTPSITDLTARVASPAARESAIEEGRKLARNWSTS